MEVRQISIIFCVVLIKCSCSEYLLKKAPAVNGELEVKVNNSETKVENLKDNENFDECVCFAKNNDGIPISSYIKSSEYIRTVVYIYRNIKGNNVVYIPNVAKQKVFPELTIDPDEHVKSISDVVVNILLPHQHPTGVAPKTGPQMGYNYFFDLKDSEETLLADDHFDKNVHKYEELMHNIINEPEKKNIWKKIVPGDDPLKQPNNIYNDYDYFNQLGLENFHKVIPTYEKLKQFNLNKNNIADKPDNLIEHVHFNDLHSSEELLLGNDNNRKDNIQDTKREKILPDIPHNIDDNEKLILNEDLKFVLSRHFQSGSNEIPDDDIESVTEHNMFKEILPINKNYFNFNKTNVNNTSKENLPIKFNIHNIPLEENPLIKIYKLFSLDRKNKLVEDNDFISKIVLKNEPQTISNPSSYFYPNYKTPEQAQIYDLESEEVPLTDADLFSSNGLQIEPDRHINKVPKKTKYGNLYEFNSKNKPHIKQDHVFVDSYKENIISSDNLPIRLHNSIDILNKSEPLYIETEHAKDAKEELNFALSREFTSNETYSKLNPDANNNETKMFSTELNIESVTPNIEHIEKNKTDEGLQNFVISILTNKSTTIDRNNINKQNSDRNKNKDWNYFNYPSPQSGHLKNIISNVYRVLPYSNCNRNLCNRVYPCSQRRSSNIPYRYNSKTRPPNRREENVTINEAQNQTSKQNYNGSNIQSKRDNNKNNVFNKFRTPIIGDEIEDDSNSYSSFEDFSQETNRMSRIKPYSNFIKINLPTSKYGKKPPLSKVEKQKLYKKERKINRDDQDIIQRERLTEVLTAPGKKILDYVIRHANNLLNYDDRSKNNLKGMKGIADDFLKIESDSTSTDDDELGIKIIGGDTATISGTPVNIKGRSANF